MSQYRTFSALVESYLLERRACGYAMRVEERRLRAFAGFADERCPGGPLTESVAVTWALSGNLPSAHTAAQRLQIVRPFARYLRRFEPRTEVPPAGLLGGPRCRPAPHLYTPDDLCALLREARRLSGDLRPHAVATVLGLLACSGLRVSEALGLHRRDVNLDDAVLVVRETKFRKTRLVPLHATATPWLRRYAALRDSQAGSDPDRAFFLRDGGFPLRYPCLHRAFRQVRSRLGWEHGRGRSPRLHDLRHSLACRRLLLWHEHGVEVDARILDLATYLGHTSVSSTYWYLSSFPELMDIVAQRFERFAGRTVEVCP
jgi:integrase